MLPQPLRHSARSVNNCAPARRNIGTWIVVYAISLLFNSLAHAQGGVPLVTVATDQSPLNLPNQFGIPAGSAINQSGDFTFIGNGDGALFFRPSGGSTIVRLLQRGDAVPGISASRVTGFSRIVSINSSKHIYFAITFSLTDTLPHVALFVYDGASFHIVVTSEDVAPGNGGQTYGPYLSPTVTSINDNGDVAFQALSVGASGETFYIVPAGGTPMRVAGSNDLPPASCAYCSASTSGFLGGISSSSTFFFGSNPRSGVNSKGQILLNLWGGLFIGTANGISLVPVASSGPCSPTLPMATNPQLLGGGVLNNVGTVVYSVTSFVAGPGPGIAPLVPVEAACIVPAGGGSSSIVTIAPGTPAPPTIGGTLTSLYTLDMDDSEEILLMSPVSGSMLTTFALLRYHVSGGQMDIVAYNSELAPGTNGQRFVPIAPILPLSVPFSLPAFSSASIANDGRVSFLVSLTSGENAIYQQTGLNLPVLLALDGQPASVSGGGTFRLVGAETEALDNGSTYFQALIRGVTTDFGEFVASGTGIQVLVDTADALPSGDHTTILAAPPKMAGHFVAFAAQLEGGRRSLFVFDISSPGSTHRVVSNGDPALADTGEVTSNFFVNESGQVAFQTFGSFGVARAGVIGFGSGSAWSSLFPEPCGTVFLWSQSTGPSKVVGPGDPSPIPGTAFSCASLNAGPPSPLNRSGQLVFHGFVPGQVVARPFPISQNGLYLYTSADHTIKEIAVNSDVVPVGGGSGSPVTSVPDLSVPLNSAGLVAFGAEAGSLGIGPFLPPPIPGFFLRTAGGTPTKVMANGDAVPDSGGTFAAPHFISDLNDNGDLTFTAGTSTGADGVFLAPAGSTIQTIALDGTAAPISGGGSFSLTLPLPPPPIILIGSPFLNIALMNQERDVVFRAGITGSTTTNSGYFRLLRKGASAGTLQHVALQGQAVPGGGSFNTIPLPGNQGGEFALGENGDLVFVNNFTDSSGARRGLFLARADGTLARILATGDSMPGGGVLSGIRMSQDLAAGSDGSFVFWAGISNGSSGEVIYATAVPPVGTTTTVSSSPNPSIFGQQVTLTASVSGVATGTPSGSVSFVDNGVSLGTSALSVGQATLNSSSLAAGPHSIMAQYSGDTNFAPSNSSAFAVSVVGFAPPPTNLMVTAGSSLVIPLTLYGAPGLNSQFMLSCPNVPSGATCAFDQNSVTPSPSGTAINVTLSTMHRSNLLPDLPRKGPGPLGLLELSVILSTLLAIAMTKIRLAPRRRVAFGMCLASLGLAALMAGCGAVGSGPSAGPGPSGTPPGPATMTVMAKSGETSVSTVVNVTVR